MSSRILKYLSLRYIRQRVKRIFRFLYIRYMCDFLDSPFSKSVYNKPNNKHKYTTWSIVLLC